MCEISLCGFPFAGFRFQAVSQAQRSFFVLVVVFLPWEISLCEIGFTGLSLIKVRLLLCCFFLMSVQLASKFIGPDANQFPAQVYIIRIKHVRCADGQTSAVYSRWHVLQRSAFVRCFFLQDRKTPGWYSRTEGKTFFGLKTKLFKKMSKVWKAKCSHVCKKLSVTGKFSRNNCLHLAFWQKQEVRAKRRNNRAESDKQPNSVKKSTFLQRGIMQLTYVHVYQIFIQSPVPFWPPLVCVSRTSCKNTYFEQTLSWSREYSSLFDTKTATDGWSWFCLQNPVHALQTLKLHQHACPVVSAADGLPAETASQCQGSDGLPGWNGFPALSPHNTDTWCRKKAMFVEQNSSSGFQAARRKLGRNVVTLHCRRHCAMSLRPRSHRSQSTLRKAPRKQWDTLLAWCLPQGALRPVWTGP